MLQLFRSLISSRVGAAVALLVVGLIALAFAAGDVAGLRNVSLGGGNRVATVGRQGIETAGLSEAATNAVENLKQQNPQLTMKAFIAQGGLDKVLDDLISRTALNVFGLQYGIIASDRLIDSEITKIPAFRGLDGKFSETVFRQLLAQRQISEKAVREDLAQGLVARQVLEPASFGAVIPHGMALRYTALLKEKRSGSIALLPSPLFAPKSPPSDKEIADYYAAHRARFIRPERRVIRYASFGEGALKAVPAPTDAEIAARYNANKAQYAARETRTLTQLILPTEAAARAVADEVSKGKTLEAAAAAKGLSAAKVPSIDKAAFVVASSQAVADAAFSAASGALTNPARSAIGWHIVHVDSIEKRPERTLDQARGELVDQLTQAKRRAALDDLTARIDDEFNNGGNLTDAAKELGVTIQSTPPLTADGKSYEHPETPIAPILAKVVPTAFSMEREGQPQLAVVEPGKTFLVYDVTNIAASAPAPLVEIKQDVASALMLDKGSAAAKASADALLAQVRKGVPLAQAAAALKLAIPPVQAVSMTREELMQHGQQPPPPLMLMFSMARGTVKILPAAGNRGWFVIALNEIATPQLKADDPLVPQAQQELSQVVGSEYADALRRAIQAELTVKRNDAQIKAVRTQLSGGGN